MGSSPRARGARYPAVGYPGYPGIIPACAGSTAAPRRPPPRGRDHPRVRGEHEVPIWGGLLGWGSSPRARGAQGLHLPPPACRGDHPRVRGEHTISSRTRRSRWGSSPRARGARVLSYALLSLRGIIPACAGSTSGHRCGRCWRGDHPRVRGEHLPAPRHRLPGWGSSPRARGARMPSRRSISALRDHPRVRGEHVSGETIRALATGSSPRARGAQSGLEILRRRPGIIPACAGSTWCCVQSEYDTRDHPRVRGEHERRPGRGRLSQGSSPRARGALNEFTSDVTATWIIPACAGSTPRRSSARTKRWDHPRVRGEHRRVGWLGREKIGSSPRARGALAA